MAKKKLTEEQESEIRLLIASNKMYEKTKKDAVDRGNDKAVKQIERAQDDIIEKIKQIDPTALEDDRKYTKKKVSQDGLFGDTDMSIFDMLRENEESRNELAEAEEKRPSEVAKQDDEASAIEDLVPRETSSIGPSTFNNMDSTAQYDVIQLPSNGQCYRSKTDRVPVAYLTAYDENIITSPNLYRDGLVIDFLLKNKVMNSDINVEDLVSGDADAIILYLRATSYGTEFPIVVRDPQSGEQIETTVDLSTLKPRDFKLVGDENGWFDFETPTRKDKIKFRYLTRKQERQLRQVTELEGLGTKARLLDREAETLTAAIMNDKVVTEADKKTIKDAVKVMERWSKKLKEQSTSEYTRMMTNNLQLQIVSVNGDTDRETIRKYINTMPARDSLMLRKYINDNRPGIDFDIEVKRPESLGGGSFKTFLNWDDSVFLNIADV